MQKEFVVLIIAGITTCLAQTWTYQGCYLDSTSNRQLRYRNTAQDDVQTIQTCTTYCGSQGYGWAGLEYADECYCDSQFVGATKEPETDCSMPCTGNSSQICGNGNRLSVYSTGQSSAAPVTNPGPSGWSLLGCYTDSTSSRSLRYGQSVSGGMTVAGCTSACKSAGWSLAGVEYSQECYCDSSIQSPGAQATSGCDMTCSGNSSEYCGGSNRLTVYQSGSTAQTDPPVAGWTALGCYTDSVSARTLPNGQAVSGGSGNMTVEGCTSVCASQGYAYAGVEYSQECYCGNTLQNGGICATDQTTCYMACSGNKGEICGGPNRLNLFYSGSDKSVVACGSGSGVSSSTTSSTTSISPTTTSSTTSIVPTTTSSTTSIVPTTASSTTSIVPTTASTTSIVSTTTTTTTTSSSSKSSSSSSSSTTTTPTSSSISSSTSSSSSSSTTTSSSTSSSTTSSSSSPSTTSTSSTSTSTSSSTTSSTTSSIPPTSTSSSTTTTTSTTSTSATPTSTLCPDFWTTVVGDLATAMRTNGQCNNISRAAIRYAFHDAASFSKKLPFYAPAAGGADGSLLLSADEINRPDHDGLRDYHAVITSWFSKYTNAGYPMAAADLIQVAGSVGVLACPGGNPGYTKVGRTDTTQSSPDGLLPQAFGTGSDHNTILQLFVDKGFAARDLAALIGAHSTSIANFQAQNGIPAGTPQDSTPQLWDVAYYNETYYPPSGIGRFDSDINLAANQSRSAVGYQFKSFIGAQAAWQASFASAFFYLSTLGMTSTAKNAMQDCTAVVNAAFPS